MSSSFRTYLAALLWFSLAGFAGCYSRPAHSTASPATVESTEEHQTETPLSDLLQHMRERLLIAHDVARWKWNARRPIADPEREQTFRSEMRRKSTSHGLDLDFIDRFFLAQIDASKQLQQDDFRQWEAAQRTTFPDVPDLTTVLRPRIDALNEALLNDLVRLRQRPPDEKQDGEVEKASRQILAGEGITDAVRALAIAPLRKG